MLGGERTEIWGQKVLIFTLTLHCLPSQPDKCVCLLAGWLENFPNYISNLVFVIIPGSTQPCGWWWGMKSVLIYSAGVGGGRPGLMGSQRYLITGDHHHRGKIVLQFIMTGSELWEMINSSELNWQFVFILSGHHGQDRTDTDPPPAPLCARFCLKYLQSGFGQHWKSIRIGSSHYRWGWLVPSFLCWGEFLCCHYLPSSGAGR